jgi:ATP-binding cassette subfamily B protein
MHPGRGSVCRNEGVSLSGIRNIDLSKSYFNKILNLPLSYFDSKFKSDLIEGLNDQSRINSLVSDYLVGMFVMLLNIIVFSFILISYNYQVF